MMFIDLHSKGDEKYAHLTAEDAAKAGTAAVEAQAWMDKNMNDQVGHSMASAQFPPLLDTSHALPISFSFLYQSHPHSN